MSGDQSHLTVQDPIDIAMADIHERVSRIHFWTLPGIDMIHRYWVRKLPSFHEHLAAQMNQVWMVLFIDLNKGMPSNYQPNMGGIQLYAVALLISLKPYLELNRHLATKYLLFHV